MSVNRTRKLCARAATGVLLAICGCSAPRERVARSAVVAGWVDSATVRVAVHEARGGGDSWSTECLGIFDVPLDSTRVVVRVSSGGCGKMGRASYLSADPSGVGVAWVDEFSGNALTVSRFDTSFESVLLHDPCLETPTRASWSTDHKRLFLRVMCADADSTEGIAVIDAQSGRILRIIQTEMALGVSGPTLAPDESAIAVEVASESGAALGRRVAILNTDGDLIRYVGSGEQPTWSPSRDLIAVTSRLEGDAFPSVLRLIHSDGTAMMRATPQGDSVQLMYTSPSGAIGQLTWSRDGRVLAFALEGSVAALRVSDGKVIVRLLERF